MLSLPPSLLLSFSKTNLVIELPTEFHIFSVRDVAYPEENVLGAELILGEFLCILIFYNILEGGLNPKPLTTPLSSVPLAIGLLPLTHRHLSQAPTLRVFHPTDLPSFYPE